MGRDPSGTLFTGGKIHSNCKTVLPPYPSTGGWYSAKQSSYQLAEPVSSSASVITEISWEKAKNTETNQEAGTDIDACPQESGWRTGIGKQREWPFNGWHLRDEATKRAKEMNVLASSAVGLL